MPIYETEENREDARKIMSVFEEKWGGLLRRDREMPPRHFYDFEVSLDAFGKTWRWIVEVKRWKRLFNLRKHKDRSLRDPNEIRKKLKSGIFYIDVRNKYEKLHASQYPHFIVVGFDDYVAYLPTYAEPFAEPQLTKRRNDRNDDLDVDWVYAYWWDEFIIVGPRGDKY